MKLVIDIPEEEYKCVQITGNIGNKTCISNAIYNGTQLPKGHGRLIDVDDLLNERLINEYISKVKCCDECFASVFCTVNQLRESRVPQKYCVENINKYFTESEGKE